ncbi:hypothetical protein SERLA73DRAFT_121689 [Serpula lacrymans var. lacrymans S7.3]|uniref:F-box domain-containing protein n=2 Tax=Serpula lacrymans var. lacrymans TaxID=341189 RepID=F8PVH6_SERL3|nr:uncharacterized protein SERLADRAFT_436868 [Serpula lacrymans var. lacrymans S7.9]EGN99529.1 hypothetical protein SERLA73DRAFT_121689 [Serpula lacrymans var. lacrymans S7.3]EGO25102.1 hypothetical protein SERLADRAFT_436868 [Serpula lacrymans var. lacrymans S7.9]
MSKHRLPSAPVPPLKRAHFLQPSSSSSAPVSTTFDDAFYDELILSIFSFLGSTDLCAIQATNSNWARLASDNQLWKALYLRDYGRPRLRGGRGFVGRADGREVKPLPGRAKPDNLKDWKWMYRISSNWRSGRCSVENMNTPVDLALSQTSEVPRSLPRTRTDKTHVLLAGSLTIVAQSDSCLRPSLYVHGGAVATHKLVCRSTFHNTLTRITALALDQSPPNKPCQPSLRPSHHIRLVALLSTGEFSVFNLDYTTPSSNSSPKLAYVPSSTTRSLSAPITHAAYHHPVLVTLSDSFVLTIYDLSNDSVSLVQTLTSFTSHPPSSLVLSAMPTLGTYKLVLAYAVPVYPAHWSVGATELIISHSNTMSPSSSHPFDSTTSGLTAPSGPLEVSTTRTARAFDVPQGWIDERKLETIREQWGRKVTQVADTQTDGKWVVLAPGDTPHTSPPSSSSNPHTSPQPTAHSTIATAHHSPTHLQLYRLHLPSSSGVSHTPKLSFVRTLHGPIGPVSALALADGRCVSLGVNGGIWVWDLEGSDTGGAVVASPISLNMEESELVEKGTVVFDERRIVSAGVRGVELRRFDV